MTGVPAVAMSVDAQRILQSATAESRAWSHDYIGTEHLLLALCRWDAVQPNVVERIGILPSAVAERLQQAVHRGNASRSLSELPYTNRTKAALEKASEETVALGLSQIGPEQLLVGLLQDRNSIATVVLASLGATLDGARSAFSK